MPVPLILGLNNVRSVFTGDTTIKDLVNEKTGSKYGYMAIDAVFSLGATLPSVLGKTGRIKDLPNGVTRYEREFDTILERTQATVEMGVHANTVLTGDE